MYVTCLMINYVSTRSSGIRKAHYSSSNYSVACESNHQQCMSLQICCRCDVLQRGADRSCSGSHQWSLETRPSCWPQLGQWCVTSLQEGTQKGMKQHPSSTIL